ncbi:MAG: S-layer homology domain-containing protein [Synergistaceae bacterium]|nr:S-layer homology domain-containing protein [Synergistaceae bacterium]
MKKFWISVLCVLCILSLFPQKSPAATNPFIDVPSGHWAYDAIGTLAARGILSGYPDGTYRGKQPTTRYEMASAIARALAVVDMTKASRQDAETLKKLVVEFKDELDALGVKVDTFDGRLKKIEDRLGGWKISGELRLDIEDWDSEEGDGNSFLSLSRLELHRWFGEDEGLYFYARLEDGGDGKDKTITFDKLYVETPFVWDSTLTVGRFDRDFEGDYRFQTGGMTDIANEAWLTDRTVDGIGFDKSFALGSVGFYVARPDDIPAWTADDAFNVWEVIALGQFQFTEQIGFDVGAQAFFGDDSSVVPFESHERKVDNLWTLFAGLRYNFRPEIALRGIYYHQDSSFEENSSGAWKDVNTDSAGAWKAIVSVGQEALKFTSLWLEYGKLEEGFYLPYGNIALTLVDDDRWNTRDGGAGFVGNDTTIWRVGAIQQWNDQWRTWLYAAGHTLDSGGESASGRSADAKLLQWGVGFEYQYNPAVAFGLGYINADWNDDAERSGYTDDHRIQFRTSVVF